MGICESCAARANAAEQSDLASAFDPPLDGDRERTDTAVPPMTDDAVELASRTGRPSLQRAAGAKLLGPSLAISSAPSSSRRRGRVAVLVMSLGLLVGAAGTAAYFGRAGKRKPAPLASVPSGVVDEVVPRWRLALAEPLQGTSAEHLSAGRTFLGLDTVQNYAAARAEFQKALVLEPRSDPAICGYVVALARERGRDLEEGARREAEALVEVAVRRSRRNPEALLAHAELLLARPSSAMLEKARQLAQEVLRIGTPDQKAAAHWVMGETYLESAVDLSVQHFEQARAHRPDDRRGQVLRARALARVGDYLPAISELESRLERDPTHWASAELLARTYLELGELARARGILQRCIAADPKSVRPRMALATLSYQNEREASSAVEQFHRLLAEREPPEDREMVRLLSHLAAAHRAAGNPTAAIDAAQRALDIDGQAPGAHLQLFLVWLERGDLARATTHLPFLQGHLGDSGLEKLLEGKLLLAQGQLESAVEVLGAAVEADFRRTDALLLAGAAAAKLKRASQAYRLVLERAGRADPRRSWPTRPFDPFPLLPADHLRGADGQFRRLSSSPQDPNPLLCEALVQFHAGNRAAADGLFSQVLKIDRANTVALSYRTLLELDRGRVEPALKASKGAVESDRTSGLARFAHGAALLAHGDVDDAARELRDATARDPKLVAALVWLAEAEARLHATDEARKRLRRVINLDDSYMEAKQALLRLERRG